MRRYLIILMMPCFVMLFGICCLAGCEGSRHPLKKVRLNEVAHSIFYAPQYVAIEKGYFEKEGIKLELTTGFGADKTATAVISGDADIAFMGPEATIYQFNQGNADYLINFAQLTQRAGNFVVSRKKEDSFKWEDLKGKKVIGGRPGGMPEMVFEYVLKKHGMNPQKDINLVQNIDFANTSGAFVSGEADYTVEFEPAATLIEEQGAGYVVASVGKESGYVPYTAFSAKKSYIEKNPEIIQKFTNAIQKGLEYVNSHTSAEIAKTIKPQFKETDEAALTAIVERYKAQDTWKTDTVFEKESFDLLQNILEEAGELPARVPYEDLVVTDFARAAVKE